MKLRSLFLISLIMLANNTVLLSQTENLLQFSGFARQNLLRENPTDDPVLINSGSETVGDTVFYSDSKDFLASLSGQKGKLLMEAVGDLNRDSLNDWAGVVTKEKDLVIDEVVFKDQTVTQLIILEQNDKGKYFVAGATKEFPLEGSNCCYVEDLEIKNSTLELQINEKTADRVAANIYKIKKVGKNWRFIGLEQNLVFAAGDENKEDSAIEHSVNLLTGEIIRTEFAGDKKVRQNRWNIKFPIYFLPDFEGELNLPKGTIDPLGKAL